MTKTEINPKIGMMNPPRCCDKLMSDAAMVEVFYGLKRPHPDFVYACTICQTWSTAIS